MGKTHKRNDRWKKDRRDQGFKQSKKFKDVNGNGHKTSKPEELKITDPLELNDFTSS